MTPSEINRRLALAIGYAPEGVQLSSGGAVFVLRMNAVFNCRTWQEFDYRDAKTIYPIAEKYDMFPERLDDEQRFFGKTLTGERGSVLVWNPCPRACVALAVVEAHGRGLL